MKNQDKYWSFIFTEVFIKKDCCRVNYKWVIIQNQTTVLEIMSNVVLDLSNYATKKELEHATGLDTSDLATKKDFIALNTEADKLNITWLTNVPISLNNLKTQVDDLDVGKLKTVPTDLKKLKDVVDNERQKTKVNNLEKKISDATTLIQI